MHYSSDTNFSCQPLAFIMNHFGASEIFLDGIKLAGFGKISSDVNKEEIYQPEALPVNFSLGCKTAHVFAIRFSYAHSKFFKDAYEETRQGFIFSLVTEKKAREIIFEKRATTVGNNWVGAFLSTLGLIHLLLYLFYRRASENLFFSLFVTSYALIFFLASARNISTSPHFSVMASQFLLLLANPVLFLTLLLFVYKVYQTKFPKIGWLAVIASLISACYVLFGWFGNMTFSMCGVWLAIFTVITMILGTLRALKEKKPGAKILGVSIVLFALFIFFLLSFLFYASGGQFHISLENPVYLIILLALMLCIPISMSIYLAYNFSITNRNLQKKLIEVEELSAKSIKQEKEKQKILETQKEVLEAQVKERTAEIVEQKKIIEEKNKDITDSINYARRIQNAIRPSSELVQKVFPDSFALYKPKDIVSGDFYFYEEAKPFHIVACADCTGHGVPGAFMSLIGHNLLTQIIREKNITSPAEILNHLHLSVRNTLKQDSEKTQSKDGMDIALLAFDMEKGEVHYAGAQRPLWIIRNGTLEELKADKFSIGGMQTEESRNFTGHSFPIKPGDCFYMSSDGFADQFGGKEGKKFMSKKMKELILSIHHKPMIEQWRSLTRAIEEWKGDAVQVDDILVIGIRL